MHLGESRLVEWFRNLRRPLRRFLALRRGVASADLDDVAQEVFLRLLRYNREDLVSDPQAYLFKVAANVASEWSMRARNRLPHDSTWLESLTDEAAQEEAVDREFENREVAAALGDLPSRAREIIRLHFAEGLKHEEIALRLGVTARIVKRDLINGYSILRGLLGDAGPQPKPVAASQQTFAGRRS